MNNIIFFNGRIINKNLATHYQAPFRAKCGENVLVYYNGKPENGKTQLDIHEENCKKCKAIDRNKKIKKIYENMVN